MKNAQKTGFTHMQAGIRIAHTNIDRTNSFAKQNMISYEWKITTILRMGMLTQTSHLIYNLTLLPWNPIGDEK